MFTISSSVRYAGKSSEAPRRNVLHAPILFSICLLSSSLTFIAPEVMKGGRMRAFPDGAGHIGWAPLSHRNGARMRDLIYAKGLTIQKTCSAHVHALVACMPFTSRGPLRLALFGSSFLGDVTPETDAERFCRSLAFRRWRLVVCSCRLRDRAIGLAHGVEPDIELPATTAWPLIVAFGVP